VVPLAVIGRAARRGLQDSEPTLDGMRIGRRGISPVMIGRAGPLARLQGLVDGSGRLPVDDDIPAVALVAGEAGVGKTRLLQELAGSVPPGTAVLVGQAEAGSLGRPLDVVRMMLGDLQRELVDARLAAIDVLTARLGEGRSLVIFEDLHWADADSVGVFEQLAAMPRPDLTLVATYRPDELTSRLPGGDMLVRLERRRHVHQVRLERLDRYEVAAFVAAVHGRTLGTAVVDALYNRTGGNPFFLEEILAAAADVEPDALANQPLPWSLAELVSRQLDGLSADERRVVEAAAVLGPRASFDMLAVLGGRGEDELIGILRGLVERGLLLEEDDDEFSFRHELVRDAVENQLLGRERRRLHEQALEVLRRSNPTELAELARHAAGAGRYDEMVALARVGVGHYIGIGATHQALRLAATALAESPDDPDLLAGATRAAWLIGALDEAGGHAERLLARTADNLDERRSAAVRLAARVAHERGSGEAMWELVGELERLVGALPAGEERAATMAAIAQINMLNDKHVESIEWAERAIDEADRIGAAAVRAQALVERATSLTELADRRDEGVEALRTAVAEAERLTDWVLLTRALHNLANVLPFSERRSCLERMREAGRRAGFDNMAAANYHLQLADLALIDGDAAAAWQHVLHVGEFVEGKAAGWVRWLRFLLLVEADRTDEAAALLESWQPKHPEIPTLMLAGRHGDAAAATAVLGAALDDAATSDCNVVVTAVESALAAGMDPADALASFATTKSPQLSGELERAVHALVAGANADHADVIDLLDDATIAEMTELRAPMRASLHLTLARALYAHSRTPAARQQAETARSLLEHWPGWRRDEVDAELSRLDSAATKEGQLTPREREVAALLGEGLSNSELARRLYISPRTAAVHVSNILVKLGMSSRAEVAAWAVRNGLTAA
jgi:DNA-binding NarL/FixJ family response regulator